MDITISILIVVQVAMFTVPLLLKGDGRSDIPESAKVKYAYSLAICPCTVYTSKRSDTMLWLQLIMSIIKILGCNERGLRSFEEAGNVVRKILCQKE